MDKFSTEMTITELLDYIRRTPKKFEHELPDKLEKWNKQRILEAAYNSELAPVTKSEEDNIRLEIATKIMVRHAPSSSMNIELLADYCVEGADALINRLKI